MVALLIVVGAVCFWGFKSGDSRSFQIAKNLDIFNSIVKELDMFYVDTIDPNKTIREGIDAMLYSLDPYTEYYPEDDQSELEQMLKNSPFSGMPLRLPSRRRLVRIHALRERKRIP